MARKWVARGRTLMPPDEAKKLDANQVKATSAVSIERWVYDPGDQAYTHPADPQDADGASTGTTIDYLIYRSKTHGTSTVTALNAHGHRLADTTQPTFEDAREELEIELMNRHLISLP